LCFQLSISLTKTEKPVVLSEAFLEIAKTSCQTYAVEVSIRHEDLTISFQDSSRKDVHQTILR